MQTPQLRGLSLYWHFGVLEFLFYEIMVNMGDRSLNKYPHLSTQIHLPHKVTPHGTLGQCVMLILVCCVVDSALVVNLGDKWLRDNCNLH